LFFFREKPEINGKNRGERYDSSELIRSRGPDGIFGNIRMKKGRLSVNE